MPAGSPDPNAPPHVKICGVMSPEQASAIAGAGADFIGINFWPRSPRYVAPDPILATWKSALCGGTRVVGVFVDPDAGHPMFSREVLDAIQLHGEETPEFCGRLRASGWRVIKAIQVRDEASLARVADYPVDDILLDAHHPEGRGGGGRTFSWELALRFKERYPDRSLWLAGGLNPGNVADAVRQVRPYAVDVASGVEGATRGIKDLRKVTEFVRRARDA